MVFKKATIESDGTQLLLPLRDKNDPNDCKMTATATVM